MTDKTPPLAYYMPRPDSGVVLRRLIEAAADEGRNVMPEATDDQAHAIEVFAAQLLTAHDELRALLEDHVIDWGRCTTWPDPCGCSDHAARSYLEEPHD